MLHLDDIISADVHEETICLLTGSFEGHLLALEQFLSLVDVVLPRMKRRVRLPLLVQTVDDCTQQAVLRGPALQRKPVKKSTIFNNNKINKLVGAIDLLPSALCGGAPWGIAVQFDKLQFRRKFCGIGGKSKIEDQRLVGTLMVYRHARNLPI